MIIKANNPIRNGKYIKLAVIKFHSQQKYKNKEI